MTLWHQKPRAGQLKHGLITGVDQVCFVVRDLDSALNAMCKTLGVGPFKCFTLDAPALFDTTLYGQPAPWSLRLAVAMVGRMQWEVIQPVAGDTSHQRHLATRYEGLHHILVEYAHHSFEDAQAKLTQLGFPLAQTARVNFPMQIGGLTLAAPQALAKSLSTPFGYTETHDALGTTLELARFPPGVSPPLAIRLGKPEWWVPEGSTQITSHLENGAIDRVVKLSFLSRDARKTIDNWVAFGVGPWIVAEIGPGDLGDTTLSDFRARIGWCLLNDTLLEVIEPVHGDTPHARLLRASGPGLHTLGVKSDTLSQPQLLAQLRANGLPVLLEGVLHGGFEFAIVDATSTASGWLELVHLDAEPLWEELCRLPNLTRIPAP